MRSDYSHRSTEVYEYLVGSAAFKAVGTSDPRPAGSIPVHLRHRSRPNLYPFATAFVVVLLVLAGCTSASGVAASPEVNGVEPDPVASANATQEQAFAAPVAETGQEAAAPSTTPREDNPESSLDPDGLDQGTTPDETPADEATEDETPAGEATEDEAPASEPAEAATRCQRVTDFAGELQQQRWRVTLDGVMGGRSSGQVTFSDSTMVFTGEIVTQGGGFSLLRTPLFAGDFDDGSFLRVRARTDGRRYEMVFKDGLEGRRAQLFHEAMVPLAETPDWQEVRVELVDLLTTSNGRTVEAAPFAKEAVSEMGIILKDGVDGPFAIELDWIDICTAL